MLTDRVWECELIKQQLELEWYKNIFIITGKTKKKEDKIAFEFIKTNWWIILWTMGKLWRWFDMPIIDCVIITAALKFKSTVIQAIGRCLRKYEWKEKIWVYFFSDNILYNQLKENKDTCEKEYWVKVLQSKLN